MAGLIPAVRQAMLNVVFVTAGGSNTAKCGSLHTADPGTTGTSEVTGGGYARQNITWTAGSGSSSGGTITFSVPAGTFTHIGYFDALTAGNFVGGYPLQASMTYAAAGTLPVTLTETLT
jgi:hypothetical protein